MISPCIQIVEFGDPLPVAHELASIPALFVCSLLGNYPRAFKWLIGPLAPLEKFAIGLKRSK
jgi:hypothetical protein